MRLIYILTGGAIGALLRYILSGVVHQYFKGTFPWGTLTVNLIGSFLIGFLWEHFEYVAAPPHFKVFIFIGLIGAFTTFSTYSLETFHLLRDKEILQALVNILANNLLGFFMCFSGFAAARHITNFVK